MARATNWGERTAEAIQTLVSPGPVSSGLFLTRNGPIWSEDVRRYFSDEEYGSALNLLNFCCDPRGRMLAARWCEDRADPQVRAAFRVSNVATLLAAQRKLPPSERMRVRVKAGSRRVGRG